MRPFTRGQIIPLDGGGGSIQFQWNPKTVEGPGGRAEYAQLKCAGGEQPFLQFACGDVPEIRLDLDISGQDKSPGFVKSQVDALVKLTKPVARGQGVNRPPRVQLIFGPIREKCVVVEVRPIVGPRFTTDLQPLEAHVSVTLWKWRET